MLLEYHPQTGYEKFGVRTFGVLKKDFAQTFFVGGLVRDLFLKRDIKDIDLATAALPAQVIKVLRRAKITVDTSHEKFGVIRAKQGSRQVEIATFRQDLPALSRYPKVRFVKTPKADSQRRDFTVNALYYDYRLGRVYDFHNGLKDLKIGQLRFIGPPAKRISEDPLRIVRAWRLMLQLDFTLEHQTEIAIEKNVSLIKKLSAARIETEITKLSAPKQRNALRKIINSYHLTTK